MTLAVHNVGQLTDDDVVKRFVVRQPELDELLSHLTDDSPPRHALMIGQRGMGKSLLLRKLAITVRSDPDLAGRWLPLLMPEELYQVTSIGELWLAALDRLAVTLDDADLAGQRTALLAERDPARLETLALQRLLAAARGRGLRVLLLAENLDMLIDGQMGSGEGWSLRQALQTEPDLLLMATAVTTFTVVEEAGEAFYGFFHRIDLHPLDDTEVRALWHRLTGSDLAGDRVIPIQILTGGNPRLITVLARFSRRPDLSGLRQDLELLIDEYTPYFKANIEVLPAIERKVFITLADIWAPATAAEVAERTRMTSSQVSALLGRLVRRGAVQAVEQEHGKLRYELTERLYNLYHLLRTPDGSGRVRALVDILIHLFEPCELERIVLPGLVEREAGFQAPPVDTLVASLLERHIDEAGVWEHMLPSLLEDRRPVLEGLLSSQQAELGDCHPDTLLTRATLAFIRGKTGDRRGALQEYQQVADDCKRVLGPDHPDTLTARSATAYYTGETGDPSTALVLFRQIATDRERVLGPDHPNTLMARRQVAYYTGKTGDLDTALDLFRQIATDCERGLGPNHPDTLTARGFAALYIGETGDPKTALDLFHQIAADSKRVLGPDHPDTLTARCGAALYTGRTGDPNITLELFRKLAVDRERVLGPDHPGTLIARQQVGYFTETTGDPRTALKLYRQVAVDSERALGPDDSITRHSRAGVAICTERVEALENPKHPRPREFRELWETIRSRAKGRQPKP